MFVTLTCVKFTQYFLAMRQRPDRASIELEWVRYVIAHPEREAIQSDGRRLQMQRADIYA